VQNEPLAVLELRHGEPRGSWRRKPPAAVLEARLPRRSSGRGSGASGLGQRGRGSTLLASPETATGPCRSIVVPSPSWPKEFSHGI
jgi:hypothetical protein